MVFTVAHDAKGVVIVTVLSSLAVDDRPVLCRAVQEQLRSPACRKLVVDFRGDDLGPAAVSAALRIHQVSAARHVPCTLVSEDRAALQRVLADNATAGLPEPRLTSSLAAALSDRLRSSH